MVNSKSVFTFAGMMDFNKVKYNLSTKIILNSLEDVKIYQIDDKKNIKTNCEIARLNNLGKKSSVGIVTLKNELDLTQKYEIEIEGVGIKDVIPTEIFDSNKFIKKYTYDGNDLGSVVNGNSTIFKVWAPTASSVVLDLYKSGHEGKAYKNIPMTRKDEGVWEHTEDNCGHGVYYTYTVTTSVGVQTATDPYAKAAGANGIRSMVIDLDSTNPDGWESTFTLKTKSYTEALIWEVHVRDFSNKISASKYPGKYLAFTESGLKNAAGEAVGLDYLVDLGVTHVHLLPVYDYATVDESNPDNQFNWGYDPVNYNVPEGSYSTNPFDGAVRVNEYKQMVKALYDKGIGVIMDVVYNHTYDVNSALNKIVPYYYYRYTSWGENSNASGCGNDTASERYMFRKFMVDSVTFWAEEYKLDGFRFDLMGLHDLETMKQIEAAVHAINPSALLYGEGWNMGSTIDGSPQANQTNINQIIASEGASGSVSVFNDVIRDGLKGSVFEKTSKGYISGAYYENESKVKFGLAGANNSFLSGWRVENAAVINYMSAHDNHTLWDKLALSNAENTIEERMAMNRIGATVIILSKGTPFMQAGEEFLRSKNGDENSYNASDEINNINWEVIVPGSNEYKMAKYYKGLAEIRKDNPVLSSIDSTIEFGRIQNGGMFAMFINDGNNASGNNFTLYIKKGDIIALLNPTEFVLEHELGPGEWELLCNGEIAGKEPIGIFKGKINIMPRSVYILRRE